MDIQAIKTDIATYAAAALHVAKEYALWAGHKIQIGISNHLIPTVKSILAWVAAHFKTFKTFVQTGPGMVFAISTGIFLLGIAAFKIADHKAYEEDLLAKTAWKTLGIFAFVSATVFTSFGIATFAV